MGVCGALSHQPHLVFRRLSFRIVKHKLLLCTLNGNRFFFFSPEKARADPRFTDD